MRIITRTRSHTQQRIHLTHPFCPYTCFISGTGPIWARHKQQALIQDEEFCVQADSHILFVPHWDTEMIKMWLVTDNENAVISNYVADIGIYDKYVCIMQNNSFTHLLYLSLFFSSLSFPFCSTPSSFFISFFFFIKFIPCVVCHSCLLIALILYLRNA